jgi:hypothetical protein
MHRFHESDEIDWERLDRFVCGRGTAGEQRCVALAAAMRTIGRSHARSAFRPEARPALARIQRRLRTISSAQRS